MYLNLVLVKFSLRFKGVYIIYIYILDYTVNLDALKECVACCGALYWSYVFKLHVY